jgi:hypothetical protein
VGQLVAEALRLYGRRFWRALPLGLSVAALGQGPFGLPSLAWLAVVAVGGAVLFTASYAGAVALAGDAHPSGAAFVAGGLAFLPFPFLISLYVLPGLAWLALVGLAVPAAMVERLGVAAALRRGVELARADYVHALGSLATLLLVYVLTRLSLIVLLEGTGDQTERVAVLLADLVISPLLFLGAALLYFDQAARLALRQAPGPAARAGNGASARTRL